MDEYDSGNRQDAMEMNRNEDSYEIIEIDGNEFLYACFRERQFIETAEKNGLRIYWLRHGEDDILDGAHIEVTPVLVNFNGMLLGVADIPENSVLEDANNPQEGELPFNVTGESQTLDTFVAGIRRKEDA